MRLWEGKMMYVLYIHSLKDCSIQAICICVPIYHNNKYKTNQL